jgi:predicted TPR repeat methyltransferase
MPSPNGTKVWRKKFDTTGKLGCNIQLSGDAARQIVEFMEAEDLPNPAAAIRVLTDMALATYPEWAAGAAVRRAIVTETRMWTTTRVVEKLREVVEELEVGIFEDHQQHELKLMETAMDSQDPNK